MPVTTHSLTHDGFLVSRRHPRYTEARVDSMHIGQPSRGVVCAGITEMHFVEVPTDWSASRQLIPWRLVTARPISASRINSGPQPNKLPRNRRCSVDVLANDDAAVSQWLRDGEPAPAGAWGTVWSRRDGSKLSL